MTSRGVLSRFNFDDASPRQRRCTGCREAPEVRLDLRLITSRSGSGYPNVRASHSCSRDSRSRDARGFQSVARQGQSAKGGPRQTRFGVYEPRQQRESSRWRASRCRTLNGKRRSGSPRLRGRHPRRQPFAARAAQDAVSSSCRHALRFSRSSSRRKRPGDQEALWLQVRPLRHSIFAGPTKS